MAARKGKKYATNPFLPSLMESSETKVQKITSPLKDDDLLLVSKTTGELPANANVGIIFTRKVEANEFMKIYVNGVAALFGLTKAGQKVFSLLYSELSGMDGKDKDVVTLYYPTLPEETRNKISYRVFCKGINDLIRVGFIAESLVPAQFFINPTYIFNGDRLALINLIEKEKPVTTFIKKKEVEPDAGDQDGENG